MIYLFLIRKKDYVALTEEVLKLRENLAENKNKITEIFMFAVLLDDRKAINIIIEKVPNYFTLVEDFESKIVFKRAPAGNNETVIYQHKLSVDVVIHYSPNPEAVLKLLPIGAGMLFPSTLHEDAFNGEEEKIEKALNEIDIQPYETSSKIRFITLLNYAAAGKKPSIVQIIKAWLDKRSTINVHRDQKSEFYRITPLHIAVNQGNKVLIDEARKNLDFYYLFAVKQNLSPLNMAIIKGSLPDIRSNFNILYRAPNYFESDNYLNDAIQAFIFGTEEVVLFFLNKGVKINHVKEILFKIEKDAQFSTTTKLLRGYIQLYAEAYKGTLSEVCQILREFPQLVSVRFICDDTYTPNSYYTESILHAVASRKDFSRATLIEKERAIGFLLNKISIDAKDSRGKLPSECLGTEDSDKIKYMLQSPLEKMLRFLFADKTAFLLIKDILGANKGLGAKNSIKIDSAHVQHSINHENDGGIVKQEFTELNTSQLRDFIAAAFENINSFRQFSCGVLQKDIAEKLNELNLVLNTPAAIAQSEFDFLEPCQILLDDERILLQQVLHNLHHIVQRMFEIIRKDNALPDVVVEQKTAAPIEPPKVPAGVPSLPVVANTEGERRPSTPFFETNKRHSM